MVKNKPLNYLLNLDLVLTGATFLVLVTITFAGVIMRYFVNRPLVWLEEVQLMCFVWIVFFGAGAAFRTGSHVAIDMVVDRFPQQLRKITEILIYIAVIIVLCYFMVQGWSLVQQMGQTNRLTNIFKIPYTLIYAAFPIGCVLMIINYSIATYTQVFKPMIFGKEGDA
ncbi:TRAP-type C4-dicarboxylate transport system, small permease component [Anoxynatronum buryatiense]|uniref:TRAP-type C4-dicarboxylate transport system, small permease component n=2 Tax=Anoxynatronum buryatiense TaxID=489973 RepID=A0AA45WTA0_9CLOT|nr:TRAP-type C4-dicarboxylate transport system, small permease component [Anoxynatronum buryatiense]